MQRIIREYTKDMLNSEGQTFSEAIDAFADVIDQLAGEALGQDNLSPFNFSMKLEIEISCRK